MNKINIVLELNIIYIVSKYSIEGIIGELIRICSIMEVYDKLARNIILLFDEAKYYCSL